MHCGNAHADWRRKDCIRRLTLYHDLDGHVGNNNVARWPDPGEIQWTDEMLLPDVRETKAGVAGLFSTATEYFKVLQPIYTNDGRLLQPKAVDETFRSRLSAGWP